MSKYNLELKSLAEKYVKGFYNITKDYKKEHKERQKSRSKKTERRHLIKC